jgi:hypothetical protein
MCPLPSEATAAGSDMGLTAQSLSLLPGYLAPAAAANTTAAADSDAAAATPGNTLSAALATLRSWASSLQHVLARTPAQHAPAVTASSGDSVTAANLAYIEAWNREVAARSAAANGHSQVGGPCQAPASDRPHHAQLPTLRSSGAGCKHCHTSDAPLSHCLPYLACCPAWPSEPRA